MIKFKSLISTHNIMQPIIYQLPVINEKLDPKIQTSSNPSPKLIKYGFNQMSDKFDVISLTKNNHYRAGLNVDFNRSEIQNMGKEVFGIKLDQDFCIFWEIMNLFGMLNMNQTVVSNVASTINQIFSVFNKLMKKKLTSKAYEKLPSKEKFTVFIQKYSDVDLTEDNIVQLILTDLEKQSTPGTSAIFQIFSTQTMIMTELIYYLSSLYNEAYIIKPLTSSNLSDEKYLVLNGLKKGAKLLVIPKMKSNTYIHSLNLSLPVEFTMIIQCINAETIPKKFMTYQRIESFLMENVPEGATYQELIKKQNEYMVDWIKIFMDLSKSDKFLEKALDQSSKVCAAHREIHWD